MKKIGNTGIEVIAMHSYAEGTEMPLGLGMALAQNMQAMERFAALPQDQQQQMIAHVHDIHSRKEMRSYVQQFAEGKTLF